MKQNSTLKLSHKWQLLLFVLAHILIFALLFHTIYKIQYSAVGLYFNFASRVLEGALPYRDFALEYPPFSLLFFILPRLAASTWTTFAIYFQAEVVIFDLVGVLVIYDIARRLQKAPWKMLSVYTLGILAMGPIIGQQYDIFPAIMSLLAVYCFCIGKHKTAWALLALGTLTKLYPAVIAPVFLIYYFRSHQYKLILRGVITFAIVSLVVMLPFLVTSPASLWSLYSYHAQRGLQLETIYSSFLLAADKLGLISIEVFLNFGSWNVTSHIGDVLAKISTYVLIVFLLASYWIIYSQAKNGKPGFSQIGASALLVIAVTLITSKVLSPQYIIWLIPFLAFATGRWRYPIWIIFIIIGILTYYLFPWYYLKLVTLEPGAIAVLLIRNLLLILLALMAAGEVIMPRCKAPRGESSSSGQARRLHR